MMYAWYATKIAKIGNIPLEEMYMCKFFKINNDMKSQAGETSYDKHVKTELPRLPKNKLL